MSDLSKWATYANGISQCLLTLSTFFLVTRRKNCIFVTPETLILLLIGAALRYSEEWAGLGWLDGGWKKVQIAAFGWVAWWIASQQKRVNAELGTLVRGVGEEDVPLDNVTVAQTEDQEKEQEEEGGEKYIETVITPNQVKISPAYLLETNPRWICICLLFSIAISCWNPWSIISLFIIKLFNLTDTGTSYSTALSFQLLLIASMLDVLSLVSQYIRILAISTSNGETPLQNALVSLHPKNGKQKIPLAIWSWFIAVHLGASARLPQIASEILQRDAQDAAKWCVVGAIAACVPLNMVLFLLAFRFLPKTRGKSGSSTD